MLTFPRPTLTALVSGIALFALSLGAVAADRVPSRLPGMAPQARTAADVIPLITGDDGVLRFEIAEDGSRFVWASEPVHEDGLPAHGTSYVSQGYIYPAGTLTDGADGVNADGSPEFPEQVLGQWSCYGWYVGDGAHATSGPWILSTQLFNFGDGWGEASLVTDGYLLADVNVQIARAVTGGTGPYAGMRGEIFATNLGFNETEGGNASYEVHFAN